MSDSAIGRYARTLSHLSPIQVGWRIRYACERKMPLFGRGAAERWSWRQPGLPAIVDPMPEVPVCPVPGHQESSPAGLERGLFTHLNQERLLGPGLLDWRLGPVASERLWTAVLHYHAWAGQLALAASLAGSDGRLADHLFYEYVSDWMDQCDLNARGARDLAWNSYTLATRIAWWIRAYRLLRARADSSRAPFWDRFIRSLWRQAAFLRDHVEWDLRANHLFRDAVGLAWAGRFFGEPRAQDWLAHATRIAQDQARRQVLPDGSHVELSPMYHVEVMADILELHALIGDEDTRRELAETWSRMAAALEWMRHPDGGIPLFNDAALNGSCSPANMLTAGHAAGFAIPEDPPQGFKHFADAGLIVWKGSPWTLFFDAGCIGAKDQPGHAHADSLTMECSLAGQRLFVDPGTFHYDNDGRRQYDRCTAAHNTVMVDGGDSSEVWHIFRVGRRARPISVSASATANSMRAEAAHDGYAHLFGMPRHQRSVEVSSDDLLKIVDRMSGRGRHVVAGGFLLAPGWTALSAAEGWKLSNGDRHARVIIRGHPAMRLHEEDRPYHPEFGREERVTRLCWSVEDALPVEIETTVVG